MKLQLKHKAVLGTQNYLQEEASICLKNKFFNPTNILIIINSLDILLDY